MAFEMTPEMRLNAFPLDRMMREAGGVLHIQQYKVWNVFRYNDVPTVLTDHARLSSELRGRELVRQAFPDDQGRRGDRRIPHSRR